MACSIRTPSASSSLLGHMKTSTTALSGGWFLTPNVLLKGEWVNQKYAGYATTDIRNGGKFSGFVFDAGISF